MVFHLAIDGRILKIVFDESHSLVEKKFCTHRNGFAVFRGRHGLPQIQIFVHVKYQGLQVIGAFRQLPQLLIGARFIMKDGNNQRPSIFLPHLLRTTKSFQPGSSTSVPL